VRLAALLLNLGQFLLGIWLEGNPSLRGDVWSGGALAAIAVFNSAALILAGGWGGYDHLHTRVRRISLFMNGILLLAGAALTIGFLQAPGVSGLETVATLGLLLPPLLTAAALLRPEG
jgi:hypothetical protein